MLIVGKETELIVKLWKIVKILWKIVFYQIKKINLVIQTFIEWLLGARH